MDKHTIEQKIINVPYKELDSIFKKTEYYFRPIIYNKTELWKDNDIDNKRCNIIVENDKVYKIDGWY
jgi:hypothetical protein